MVSTLGSLRILSALSSYTEAKGDQAKGKHTQIAGLHYSQSVGYDAMPNVVEPILAINEIIIWVYECVTYRPVTRIPAYGTATISVTIIAKEEQREVS